MRAVEWHLQNWPVCREGYIHLMCFWSNRNSNNTCRVTAFIQFIAEGLWQCFPYRRKPILYDNSDSPITMFSMLHCMCQIPCYLQRDLITRSAYIRLTFVYLQFVPLSAWDIMRHCETPGGDDITLIGLYRGVCFMWACTATDLCFNTLSSQRPSSAVPRSSSPPSSPSPLAPPSPSTRCILRAWLLV